MTPTPYAWAPTSNSATREEAGGDEHGGSGTCSSVTSASSYQLLYDQATGNLYVNSKFCIAMILAK